MNKKLIPLLVCFSLAIVSLTAASQETTRYPIEIADFQQWEKFPAQCADYRRSTVRAYAPALADYSVAYQSFGNKLKNAVTLFFYPRMKDSSVQLRAEVSEVLNAHQDRADCESTRNQARSERQGVQRNADHVRIY